MDKLNQSLDLFTEGLRSDPEIRLDIRRELQSHLEEKIAEETAQGHSNEESLELALKTFGSPVEVADGLAAANRRRMNFRARMRLLAGALLIPAVIICAFFSLNITYSFMNMTHSIDHVGKSLLDNSGKIFSFDIFRRYTPEQQLILYGDPDKKTRIEQQKAIWEKFPDNKIYAANYIISLISLGNSKDCDFIAEIGRAGKIDPDNALYNYLAAGILLQDACSEVGLPREDKKAKQQYRFELKDRVLLEKAMHEYLAGVKKKYCNSYTADLLKQRLQIMGEANSLTGQFEQMVLGAGTLLPQLSNYRNIGRYMPEYANILIKEGRKQEALQYLNTWKQFFQHVNSDGNWFIGVLITTAIASIDAEKLPPLYNKLGMAETAKTVTLETELLSIPVREWKESKREKKTIPYSRGGILTGMLLPALGRECTSEELAPERYAEYVLCQKITLSLINFILITWMICAIGAALYWRFRSGARLLLLSPPPLTVLKILGLGVVLPCVVYFVLSQIEPLSGYDYGLAANGARFVAQMALLLLLIPAIVLILSGRYVTARCRELGVETPPPSGKIQKISVITGLVVLVFAAFAPLSMTTPQKLSPTAIILLIAGIILAVLVMLRIAQWAAVLFNGKKYSVYYGATARTVMLTFALAVLVLTCFFRPILDWREAEFIREDKIMFGSAESFTKVEGEVVRDLKNAINQALTRISK
ncbi:MAG: permease prefix domain 1-containing protein [Lentisphaerota bacterium]